MLRVTLPEPVFLFLLEFIGRQSKIIPYRTFLFLLEKSP